ncbi:MAG TPA: hypothetical protein DD657_00495 [Culturomica sp.]|nr:hypothetical protein [Culturomica sp.]
MKIMTERNGKVRMEIDATNFSIMWGDGTNDNKRYHVYQDDGLFEVVLIGRNLRRLDISGCGVTDADFGRCNKLRELRCGFNFLEVLDFCEAPNLEVLVCNTNDLVRLNIDGCMKLRYMDCRSNRLSWLDLKERKELYELECCHNELKGLEIEGCGTLKYLSCFNNRLSDEKFSCLLNSLPERSSPYGCFYGNKNPGFRLKHKELMISKGWRYERHRNLIK